MRIKGWSVTRTTLQNRPHAWMKHDSKGNPVEEIVIEITNPIFESRGYPVNLYQPTQAFPKRKIQLGVGYVVKPRESWNGAYEHAREIAMHYMQKDGDITTNSEMQKVRRIWKCDICGSTDISNYKELGKKCNRCGRLEDIDELESRYSKIRVLQMPI